MNDTAHVEPVDFRVLFESAPGLYLVLAPDFTIVAASDAYVTATMVDRAAILGRGLFEVFPDNPDNPAATGVRNLRSSLERVLAHRRTDTMAVQKYDVQRPDDGRFEERYWSPVNFPVVRPDGELVYIIHRVEDVTEFVRSSSDESSIEEHVRSRAATMGAEIYRRAQEIQEANRELRGLHAILEARVQARTIDLEREIAERQRTEESLRRTEEQFRQSQKMEAIGRLAGGVAHDFNNLLSVILVYCDSILLDLGPSHPSRDAVTEIQRAGERAAALTRQLLAFSRQQVLEARVVDLNSVVAGMENMMHRLLGEDVEMRILSSRDLGQVRADPGQVEQVLLNLIVNARDAMPSGGRLTIETKNVTLDQEHAEQVGAQAGPHVMLVVSDTGVGMDAATRSRIFEPFFTTKERGKGTGLGLSTVFGIVKQSGGTIWVYSEPGKGATFRVYLPRVDAPPVRAELDVTDARQGPRSAETILLVEDEEQLRAVAARILERAGYHVLTARDADEAMRVCRDHPGRIHLLLTDLVMPGWSGRQLAEHAVRMRPDMRVLYMSGYTDDVIVRHGVVGQSLAFLQKPITTATLNDKVRAVLQESG